MTTLTMTKSIELVCPKSKEAIVFIYGDFYETISQKVYKNKKITAATMREATKTICEYFDLKGEELELARFDGIVIKDNKRYVTYNNQKLSF